VSGEYDVDWLVIGSGFGGSVSALRLAEKGYRVAVLESGRRYEDEDFAKTTWNARRYYWLPRLGLRGIFRMTLFKDVFVVSGCGVGGGSLGYAQTLYRPQPGSAFYRDAQWAELEDWETELEPHYDAAERMLGVTQYEGEGPADRLLRELAEEMGVPETYSTTRVGVFFGEPGETVPDPYFGGDGPPRAGCIRCGACMVGCRYNAKNTLVKNYLWFAERKGVVIHPERTVADIRPLGAADGSEGYVVTHERSGAWVRKHKRETTARGVVVAAGALGTNMLLQRCRLGDSLPRLSERIGYLVRTNSEAITAVTTKNDRHDFTKSVAITSSFYPDENTHVENVTYGRGADSISFMFTILTAAGTTFTRPLKWLRPHAVAVQVVAAHGDPPHHADARQLDPAAAEAQRARPRPAAADGGGRGQAEPALHRAGRHDHAARGREARRDAADRRDRGAAQHPDHRAHHGRRRHRRGPGVGRGRLAPSRVRLREPARLRRGGDPREHRREPEPHHHRDGRARHEPRPAEQ
jgi:cholesterol oxidase